MNRILLRIAYNVAPKQALTEEIIKVLDNLYKNYPPKQNANIWTKPNDAGPQFWTPVQIVLMSLERDFKDIEVNDVLDTINEYVDKKITPELEHHSILPEIQIILNSPNDTDLTINFDPSNSYYRDSAVVIMREYHPDKTFTDHVFMGRRGENHSMVQEQHKNIYGRCIDENGRSVICYANYWKPIVFITNNIGFSNIQDVVKAIKSTYPEVQKIYTFNGGMNGGRIHKEGKLHRRLLQRIG